MTHLPQRGFTLLIAVVLSSVVLALGLALLDIAYKQVVLASSAKNSQYAFYAADAALECALYYDQQLTFFAYNAPPPSSQSLGTISCSGQSNIEVTQFLTVSTSTALFFVPCEGGGSNASVEVHKGQDGATGIYAYGYNTCDESAPRRIERGLKVLY